MDTFNIVVGILGIVSFIFSIYTYFKIETRKQIEAAKNAMIKEKMKAIENELTSIFHNADLLVQSPKLRNNVSIEELQNIGRIIRAQSQVGINYLAEEERKLDKWRFGKLVESENLEGI